MKVETLKDLEAVVKMCNKHGVSNITVDGISLVLSGEPAVKAKNGTATDSIETPDEYTPEQLLMWSSNAANDL